MIIEKLAEQIDLLTNLIVYELVNLQMQIQITKLVYYSNKIDPFEVIDDSKKEKVENYKLDNAEYTGEMICGIRHGVGTQIWEDGARYEGEWKYDRACGYGTFYHVDGDIYKGT